MNASTTPSFHDAPPIGVRGRYQRVDTPQTLREGLEEYYAVNPGLSVPSELADPHSAQYFHNHDCTHVIFGTHTGVVDEGVNDLLTFLAVDIRVRDYVGGFFASSESEKITQGYAFGPTMRAFWRTLKLLPATWRHSRSMTHRWPWTPPRTYLDRPLADLRAEYGIVPFRTDVALGLADPS